MAPPIACLRKGGPARRRRWRAAWIGLVWFIAVWAGAPALQAQLAFGFKWADFFDPQEMTPGTTNRLKTLLVGKQAQMLTNALALVTEPWLGRFGTDGKTNLAATSPMCLLDRERRLIHSTNQLKLTAGDGQMLLEGQGFLCHLTNFNLIVSNRVRTLIRRDIAHSARGAVFRPGGPTVQTGAAAGTNPFVRITSEWANFEYHSNRATYVGNVLVEDPPSRMRSDKLTIQRSTNGAIERILAEGKVVLVNTQDQSRVTGDQALYFLEEGRETVFFSGQPARWQAGQRPAEAEGRRLIYDLARQTLRVEEQARLRLPRSALSQGDWVLARPGAPTPVVSTNDFVDVTAAVLDFELPASNRLTRTLLARTNVVIYSPADDSRATGDQGVYREATGTLELTGRAVWQRGARVAKGDRLFFDRTNRVFRAAGNAFLRMPVAEFQRQAGPPARAATSEGPPQFIETTADHYEYRDGFLTFYEPVHGRFLEGEILRGTLDCGWVQLKLSNQVERIEARQNVRLEQLPWTSATGKVSTKKLSSELLVITLGTNGLVQRAVARTNVVMHQAELRPGKPPPSFSWLSAEEVTADFFPHTNQVRTLTAVCSVQMAKDDNSASGEHAVYTATNELVELTGNPQAHTPKVTITKADRIIWDRARNRIYTERPAGEAAAPISPDKVPRALMIQTNRPATNAPPPGLTPRKPRHKARPWQ